MNHPLASPLQRDFPTPPPTVFRNKWTGEWAHLYPWIGDEWQAIGPGTSFHGMTGRKEDMVRLMTEAGYG